MLCNTNYYRAFLFVILKLYL